jgi:hypothetical protein
VSGTDGNFREIRKSPKAEIVYISIHLGLLDYPKVVTREMSSKVSGYRPLVFFMAAKVAISIESWQGFHCRSGHRHMIAHVVERLAGVGDAHLVKIVREFGTMWILGPLFSIHRACEGPAIKGIKFSLPSLRLCESGQLRSPLVWLRIVSR